MAAPERGPQVRWSPDGRRFLIQRGTKLGIYEVSSRSEKGVIDLSSLRGQADEPVRPEAFEWENRGVAEQPIQWFPDSARLLVMEKNDLFVVQVDSGKSEHIVKTKTSERDPKLSPDGKRISYRVDGNLFTMDLASKRVRRLTKDASATIRNGELDWVYPEELAIPTAYWWSPDSRRIAYLRFDLSGVPIYPHGDVSGVRPVSEPQRYPQAGTRNSKVALGIVDANGGATSWVALPEVDGRLIARVNWLPDASGVAALLLNRIQNRLMWVKTEKAAGGRTVKFLEQTDPTWVNIKDDYRFLSGNGFLFGAERPDYRHLYLQAAGAHQPHQLTSGDWEVTELACVNEEREEIYYVSTEMSPLERHLYRIKFDGSGKTQITKGRGTYTVSMAPGCAHFTASHSSLEQPALRTLHSAADGAEIAVLTPRNTEVPDEYELLPNELIRFKGADGTLFHARLIKPAGFDASSKYPAIVQVYGGPHAQSVRNSWRGADFDQYLAHRGFVIWQVDNRGSAGRGHLWESKLYRRFGKQELEDQVEGVKHLLSMGFVDPARVAINGWSYGGFMTLYSLFNAPKTFAAGIAGAPVTDWRQYDTIYTERYLGLPDQNEAGYRDGSPVHQAAKLEGQLMLVHNFEDDNVLFQHTLRMMDALQRAGKQFDFMLYPQKSHAVSGAVRRQMLEGMARFFERALLNSNPAGS